MNNLPTDDILLNILTTAELDKHLDLMQALVYRLLRNESISYNYVLSLFEKKSNNLLLNIQKIDLNYNLYHNLKNTIINVLKKSYLFWDFGVKQFFRKMNVEKMDCGCPDFSIIRGLIEDNSYQSFTCLNYIASCLPFLFDPNENCHIKIINKILPALNYLSSIYDDQNSEEKTNNLKLTCSAISILFSCMNSVKFISYFIPWLFENLASLTESQIVCMSVILSSLFQTKQVNKIIFGYSIKYNLLDIIYDLLSREIPNPKFKSLYAGNLYSVVFHHILFALNIQDCNDFIFINNMHNGPINPFDLLFNYSTVLQVDIEALDFNIQYENEYTKLFTEYLKTINKIHCFSLLCNDRSDIDLYSFDDEIFLLFKNDNIRVVFNELPDIPETLFVQRYFLTECPKWAFDFLEGNTTFGYPNEHYEYILSLIKESYNIMNRFQNEDKDFPFTFKPKEFYKDQIHNVKLIDKLLNIFLESDEIKYPMHKKKYEYEYYFELINEYLLKMKSQPQFKINKFLYRVNRIFDQIWKTDLYGSLKRFLRHQPYIKLLVNNYFELTLSTFDKKNNKNISDSALILLRTPFNPNRSVHIIGYIFAYNPTNISSAIEALQNFNETKLACIMPIIKRALINELKRNDFNYINILVFINSAPSLINDNNQLFINFLSKCIIKYNEEHDSMLLDFIIKLFNSLAPERNKFQQVYLPKSNEISFIPSVSINNKKKKILKIKKENYLLDPAPNFYLQQENTKFWTNVYEKHRGFLSKLLEENESLFNELTFLQDYYELVPFRIRSNYFKSKMETNRSTTFGTIEIKVSRSNILKDTFDALSKINPMCLKGGLRIIFTGERGIDAGGLTAEWFTYVTKELFNPDYGLFIQNENNCYHPSSLSYLNEEHLEYFKLAGKIIALALYQNQCLNAHLSLAFYRQILHQNIKITDLQDFDDTLYNSLKGILDIDDVSDLCLTFAIDDDQFGKITTIELVENGENVEVTNENRMEYVSLYANYKLRKSVIKQITAFCSGFEEIIPPEYFKIFSPSELDLLICGIPQIDLEDMKNFAYYEHPYHINHPTIIMFFNVLSKWSQENVAKFLLFVSGSSQVPVGGFKYFKDCGKPFRISYIYDKYRLPVAHTCFRTIDLPEYDDENDMNEKLMMAINNCDFGLS